MGGQACVFYGAAEFSRDLDLLVLADASSLGQLRQALDDLQAENIAVPPLDADFLSRGHAVHFRCRRPDVAGLRIDLMSALRGLPAFETIWSRRTVLETGGIAIDLLSIPDLVAAKKTQRDKDWPMIRRLLERAYFDMPADPPLHDIDFLLRELRTPELLEDLAGRFPDQALRIASTRPAVHAAIMRESVQIAAALNAEETAERNADRRYWMPLKEELGRLRLSRRRPQAD